MFAEIFQKMLTLIPSHQLKRDVACKLLDSTGINLKGRGFEWTKDTATLRCQGLKVHVGIEHESSHLWFVATSKANVNDVTVGKTIPITPGAFYVMDKAYCDYNWWAEIHHKGAYFVTRLKQNAAYQVIAEDVTKSGLKAQMIELTNRSSGGKKNDCVGIPLYLVHVPHPSKPGKSLAVVSNALHLSVNEIAQAYKKRWKVELLFKFLKHNTKLKRFIGESENAVLIQIYTALISYILLMLYQKLFRVKSTLFEVLTFIKAHLMNLIERIMHPPNQSSLSRQKTLPFIR